MHPDRSFHITDRDLMRHWVEEIGFGMVFAQTPNGPRVAHIPVLFEGPDTLEFHLSRGNALTRYITEGDALFVVNGPDSYISANWYDIPDQVPTWNYLSIELEGTVSRIERDVMPDLIDQVTAYHEAKAGEDPPWTRDKMAPDKFEGMLQGIVGFRMAIKAWRGTAKLSQNKLEATRLAAADKVAASGRKAMAMLMRNVEGDG
ncbi:MAG: FMN-binding negative transcriptional regulator [Pseudomonadota bacterium]